MLRRTDMKVAEIAGPSVTVIRIISYGSLSLYQDFSIDLQNLGNKPRERAIKCNDLLILIGLTIYR